MKQQMPFENPQCRQDTCYVSICIFVSLHLHPEEICYLSLLMFYRKALIPGEKAKICRIFLVGSLKKMLHVYQSIFQSLTDCVASLYATLTLTYSQTDSLTSFALCVMSFQVSFITACPLILAGANWERRRDHDSNLAKQS